MGGAMDSRHSSQFSRFLALILISVLSFAIAHARQQSTTPPQNGSQQQQTTPPEQKTAPQVVPQSQLPPPPPAPAKQPEHKITVPVDLVQIDATVTDKNGKPVKGLTRENFELFEEGKPQKLDALDYFDVEKIETAEKDGAEPVVIDLETASDPESLRPIVKDRRLIVLFFDLTSMQPDDLLRSTDAAKKYLKEQMSPADLVAVISFGTTFKINANFTNNRDVLLKAVESLVPGKEAMLQALSTSASDAVTEDNMAAFTPDDTEFNIFNTDSKLYAIQALAELLGGVPGKKSVLEFTGGITQTGEENRSALQSATDAANKNNVSFYEADARGLMTDVPGGDASHGAATGTSSFNGATVLNVINNRQSSRNTLFTLAADTGGRTFFDLNDFSGIFKQMQDDTTGYYLLSYYSSNTARDGRYRQVKVKLVNVPAGLQIKARPGYYAPKDFGIFNTEDKEKQLDNAMATEAALNELPIAVDTAEFRVANGQYFVPVSAKLASSSLQWARKSGQHQAQFDFLYEVREVKSKAIAGSQRNTMTVQLDNANFDSSKALVYQGGILLGPGHYRLKFLARENQTGHIGTFEEELVLPPQRTSQLELSTVLLSSQLAARPARRGGGGPGQNVRARSFGQDARFRGSPLDVGGDRIVPSVTRVFNSQQTLYVFFQAYAPPKTEPAKLRAGLVFFHNGQQTNATAVVEPAETNDLTHSASFRMSLPLDKLATGNYTVQAVVVEEGGQQAAFARNYFALRKPPEATPTATPSAPGPPNER
jgi:VWFA-related protein